MGRGNKLVVTIVTDSYYPIVDGVARFVDALGKCFAEVGHKVYLVVPKVYDLPRFDYDSRPFEFIQLPTIPIDFKNYYACIPNRAMRNTIRNSDLIIVNSMAFTTAYALFFNRFYHKPVIEFVHADEREILHYTANIPDSLIPSLVNVMKRMSSKIDYFAVATNKFKRRTLDFGVNENQIFRVPFGYDPKPVDKEDLDRYYRKVDLDPEQPVLLYLGRLSDEKNIMRVVEVMGQLSQDHDIQCVIAGSGYKSEWIREYIQKKGYSIRLLGRVPDYELHLVYTIGDIFFSPSFHESLGFTTVEAMSYGTIPAINGQYKEEELDESNSLQLNDITDVKAMKSQILELFQEPETMERMQQEALETSKQFRWPRFNERWREKVEQITKVTK